MDNLAYAPQLRGDLQRWRKEYAESMHKPAFNVCSNKTLDHLVTALPGTEQELLAVHGLGPAKVREFGTVILEICRRHAPSRPPQSAASGSVGGCGGGEAGWKAPLPKRRRMEQAAAPAAAVAAPPALPPEVISPDMLTAEQRAAADRALRGENLFISGAAGTGKSFLLRYVVQELEQRHPGLVAVTAPTGIAAVNVGGVTVHSFAGIGLGDVPEGTRSREGMLLSRVRRSPANMARWKDTKVLIIDEISMLEPELFEMLDYIGCQVRYQRAGFGGLQLLFCGDFLQLPPVRKDATQAATFCFEVPTWKKCGLDRGTVILRQAVRQQGDLAFVNLLNAVRMGNCSAEVQGVLGSCCLAAHGRPGKPIPNDGILPTKLYCTNRDVDAENEARLREIPGEPKLFNGSDTFFKKSGTDYDKKILTDLLNKKVPVELKLKVGAQVVLLKKLGKNLVNGSRGVVESLDNGGASVRFDNGVLQRVDRSPHVQAGRGGSELRRSQLPLKLGWALTIHRAQGMTLTRAEVQLEDCFMPGQAYVAISRLTGIAGLWIKGRISPEKIRAHPNALQFYGMVP